MYERVRSELDARSQAAASTTPHGRELPEAMRKYLHWVMREVHVTAQHAAAALGHHEAHAHAVLNDLVARGFLHRTAQDGQVTFRARSIGDEGPAAPPHLWHSLIRRTTGHS